MTNQFKTLEDFLRHGADSASSAFLAQGHLEPMWICETGGGDMIIVGGDMPSRLGNDRNKLAAVLKAAFKAHGVVRYVFMTEAWSLEKDGKSKDDLPASIKAGASIESHPDRREVISLTAESRDKHLLGMMYILRPEHGSAKLSEFKLFDDGEGKIEGRFTGLLGA
jgi:hypothetical protein